MKIFTISSGSVHVGATVTKFTLQNGKVSIPAIEIGEEGRNRILGVLPVTLSPANYKIWQEKGRVTIQHVSLGVTQKGNPRLVECEPAESDVCIAIFLTKIGFRGGNDHTGDFAEMVKNAWGEEEPKYKPFPGKIITEGRIAQGHAGRMGSGEQYVAMMPKDIVFRTSYSGRLYGADREHFYKFDGSEILVLTAQERELSELF